MPKHKMFKTGLHKKYNLNKELLTKKWFSMPVKCIQTNSWLDHGYKLFCKINPSKSKFSLAISPYFE